MGKHKDLSEFDKDQIVMARQSEQRQNSRSFGVFLVCSGQYLIISDKIAHLF